MIGLIPLLGGIFFTCLAFRIIGKPPGADEHTDAWHARYGLIMKILGPILLLLGIVRLALEFMS